MHILLTNDDGPPSDSASPYILTFVRALQAAGHAVSVVIPSEQRSWIGKAHIINREVATHPYWPASEENGGNGLTASTADGAAPGDDQPWILVDSTPATCAQLGLSGFFFRDRGKIDLVISGPNYGRNTTAVFALSSGTLGAALEASVCGYRAIALSFAFKERKQPRAHIEEACHHSVKVCEALARMSDADWKDARLYSINVPVVEGVSKNRVVWTRMLQNFWTRGGCFREVDVSNKTGDKSSVEEDAKAKVKAGRRASNEDLVERRASSSAAGDGGGGGGVGGLLERQFKWAPRFSDVFDSVQQAGPGTDGWTVNEGETSVTALRANFMHVDGVEGVFKL